MEMKRQFYPSLLNMETHSLVHCNYKMEEWRKVTESQFKDLMNLLNVRLILYIGSSEITDIHTCTYLRLMYV